eukprot:CAMPEP_0198296840 /NCGR_PEP_ID=MMETSP1449-20131203/34245_1 /TAXON_ID=420275 /ORGANISM="Attheya septentrionalis, Strain CCMP2084" /LENGTH=399 /DNA_ID=CAMNT_0043997573 /DNA_START=23 /DNA_END=1222 /DNA_ORIENTATION=-
MVPSLRSMRPEIDNVHDDLQQKYGKDISLHVSDFYPLVKRLSEDSSFDTHSNTEEISSQSSIGHWWSRLKVPLHWLWVDPCLKGISFSPWILPEHRAGVGASAATTLQYWVRFIQAKQCFEKVRLDGMYQSLDVHFTISNVQKLRIVPAASIIIQSWFRSIQAQRFVQQLRKKSDQNKTPNSPKSFDQLEENLEESEQKFQLQQTQLKAVIVLQCWKRCLAAKNTFEVLYMEHWYTMMEEKELREEQLELEAAITLQHWIRRIQARPSFDHFETEIEYEDDDPGLLVARYAEARKEFEQWEQYIAEVEEADAQKELIATTILQRWVRSLQERNKLRYTPPPIHDFESSFVSFLSSIDWVVLIESEEEEEAALTMQAWARSIQAKNQVCAIQLVCDSPGR